MKNHTLSPLTEQEKKFAEESHDLVYKLLRIYGYSIEEYYDIAIFGYLKAVQLYLRREDLRNKFKFSTICWLSMKTEIKDNFVAQNAQKRKPVETVVSLDAEYAEGDGFYNIIGGKSTEADVLEKIMIDTVLENLPEKYRKITHLKMNGYNNKEIYTAMGIPSSTYTIEMQRIRVAVKELMFD
ncbi:hypothetical protein [Lacrimispora sp.]|uniref:hypothetical protein n=1 Tax=Lacrimispora sp. TaxID=2719234 RepID=UPI0028ABE296|nr:hypothetical protein [Lacrimispora sp.]